MNAQPNPNSQRRTQLRQIGPAAPCTVCGHRFISPTGAEVCGRCNPHVRSFGPADDTPVDFRLTLDGFLALTLAAC